MLFIALINNVEFGMGVRQYVRQNYMVWQDSVSIVEPDYKGCSLYQGMFGIPGMFVITGTLISGLIQYILNITRAKKSFVILTPGCSLHNGFVTQRVRYIEDPVSVGATEHSVKPLANFIKTAVNFCGFLNVVKRWLN